MQTILEILNKTTEYFKKCGVPDPRLDAQYLLAHGLGMTRMDLYLKFEAPLSQEELDKLRPMVQRRGKREPLQHILGSTSFCGHEILCDKRALIPRPETEDLVEKALLLIKDIEAPQIIDVGTGTAAIAIAIAYKRPDAHILATDISSDALELARTNVAKHSLQDRIELLQSDLLTSVPANRRFHLLVSNPPYIESAVIPNLQPEVSLFDPHQALDGGGDGLEIPRRLLKQAYEVLNTGAKVILEVGEGQADLLKSEFSSAESVVFLKSHRDFAGVERFPEFEKRE